MLVSTPVRVDVLVLMTTELCARVFLYFSFPIDEILEMSHKSEHPPPFFGFSVILKSIGTGEVAQWVKCLLCSYENQRSDPSTHLSPGWVLWPSSYVRV